jgi:hypothetical protein
MRDDIWVMVGALDQSFKRVRCGEGKISQR